MTGFNYTVGQGDSTTKLAFRYGFFPDTVWQHAENAELRSLRSDMNILLPGDVIHIPARQTKTVDGATEQLHRFRRKGVPEKLRVQFFDLYNKPLGGKPYKLNLDGTITTGSLNGDGVLDVFIPPDARVAVIEIGPNGALARSTMMLGNLDPIEVVSGVKKRLANLGYYRGPDDDQVTEEYKESLRQFQRARGIEPSGTLDDATQSELEAAHQS